MFQSNKKIPAPYRTEGSGAVSTPIGILIIIVFAVLVAGIVIWQSKQEIIVPEVFVKREEPPKVNCSVLEKEIEKEIIKANYCQKDEDCIISYFGCPFGCYNLINKEEKEKLQEKINRFRNLIRKGICPLCKYKCPRFSREVGCINNKCLPKITEEMKKCDKDVDCGTISWGPSKLLCECVNISQASISCPFGIRCVIDECVPCKCLNGLCVSEKK